MTEGFEIHGTDQFLRLSKALKDAGRLDMRKELHTALRKAPRRLIPETRREARERLPRRGGLAELVAKAPQRVKVTTGRNPGVRITAGKPGSGARAAERGRLRHPVFGNRRVWVTQEVTPGWFSEPLQKGAPAVRRDLEHALEVVAERIVREAS